MLTSRLLSPAAASAHAWSVIGSAALVACCFCCRASAETTAPTKPISDESPRTTSSFSLLPKPFQQNPDLNLTVFTEVTPEGKKLPAATPEHPAYYVAHASGYRAVGRTPAEKRLTDAEIDRLLQRSLAGTGYLPSDDRHPPSLLITYFWGTSYLPDADDGAATGAEITRNILDRAALVGGTQFAAELDLAMQKSTAVADASATSLRGVEGDSMSNLGAAQAVATMNALADPVKLFAQKDPRHDFLVSQAMSDCYYVVASAFDYASIGTNNRRLLWRTRLTVAAQGVSQLISLPTLVASASPYFGRETPEGAILRRRAVREGKVDVGTPTVVDAPNSAPAPAK